MSKKLIVGSELKQPSMLGFVAKKTIAEKSHSVFRPEKPSQRTLTENCQSATSTPTAIFATSATSKTKFKYVPVKRKSESLIEISDDSRSPTRFENPASKRTHLIESDDDLFDFDVNMVKVVTPAVKVVDVDKAFATMSTKYETPKKPVKANAIQLTPEEKFDLDKALSLNDTYANAQKKLDENLQQVKENSRILTNKTGAGKFKFNKPRAALNATNDAGEGSVQLSSTSEVQPLRTQIVASKPSSFGRVESVGPKQMSSTCELQPLKTLIAPSKQIPAATFTSTSVHSTAQKNDVIRETSKEIPNSSNHVGTTVR